MRNGILMMLAAIRVLVHSRLRIATANMRQSKREDRIAYWRGYVAALTEILDECGAIGNTVDAHTETDC